MPAIKSVGREIQLGKRMTAAARCVEESIALSSKKRPLDLKPRFDASRAGEPPRKLLDRVVQEIGGRSRSAEDRDLDLPQCRGNACPLGRVPFSQLLPGRQMGWTRESKGTAKYGNDEE